jgi:hypothetical protein
VKNKKKKRLFFLVLLLCIGFFGFGGHSLAEFSSALVAEEFNNKPKTNCWLKIYNPTKNDIVFSGKKFGLTDEETLEINNSGNNYLRCHEASDKEKNIDFKSNSYVIIAKDPERFQRENPENTYPINRVSMDTCASKDYIRISGDRCAIEKPIVEPKIYTDQIILNEILPNPSGDGEEYIELFNNSAEDASLVGWILRDGSKTGKYVFSASSIIKVGDFLVVYKKDFKFALNDSGSESVQLFDPTEKEVSSVSYSGAKDGLSFGLDGSKWRWSKYLTPREDNVFDDSPSFKVIKDKEVFKNFPANFDVQMKKYKKNKTKITWNFGDGHKSYKKTTTHKYEKKGKYKASVKIFNGSEEISKEFKVEVKSFPKYDVEIISVNPNPDGSDTDLETLTVRNNSKKKVNLQNWSIATGDKKLTNHPIALKTVLKPKETLTITRALSKFTLNNKKAQVELRYPSGKVASSLKYDKKTETIAEGEILEKTKLGWVWKNTATTPDVSPSFAEATAGRQETNLLAVAPESEQNVEGSLVLGESAVSEKVPPARIATRIVAGGRVEHLVGERMLDGGQSSTKNKKDFKIFFASFAYAPFLVN